MDDPTAPYGLDLRQSVADHLGPEPRVEVEAVLAEARRALNTLLHERVRIHDHHVQVLDATVDVAAALRAAWSAIDLYALVAELLPRTVVLTISGKDFEHLTETSMRWGPDWQDHIDDGRFEPTTPHAEPVRTDWAFAHWIGDQWSAVMLVRAYLDATGHRYQILHDVAEHPDGRFLGYVVLTDHGSPSWELFDKRDTLAS